MKAQQLRPLAAALIAPPMIAFVVQWIAFAVFLSGYWESIDKGRDDGKEHDTTAAAMHDYAQSATGNLFVMNGGAIIAVLTFVGHFLSTDNEQRIERGQRLTIALTPAVAAFCCGLFCAVLLGFGYYFGLLHFVKTSKEYTPLWRFVWASLFTSMTYFVAGTGFSMYALRSFSMIGNPQRQPQKSANNAVNSSGGSGES